MCCMLMQGTKPFATRLYTFETKPFRYWFSIHIAPVDVHSRTCRDTETPMSKYARKQLIQGSGYRAEPLTGKHGRKEMMHESGDVERVAISIGETLIRCGMIFGDG